MPQNTDLLLRGIYATDASIYQMLPLAVATPKNREEVIRLVCQCAEQQKPLLPRGAGTSLTGQAINEAVLLDLSKYMNRILEWNLGEQWVRVEPGIVCGELNAQLKPHGLHFAPDPATLNRATIGGMIANNSAGMRSVCYGMTIDHILELDLALSDGEVLHLAPLAEPDLDSKCQQNNREGQIYRGIRNLVEQNADEIRQRYPKVIRRSGGYALDALLNANPWNLAKLICGSEGTLGIVLEAKLRLTPLPKHSALCLAHFDTLDASLRAAPSIVEGGASAAELIDGTIIQQARLHPLTRDICNQVEGNPAALLVIETQGDDQTVVINQIHAIARSLTALAYAAPVITDQKEIRDVWQMRSSALGLMTTLQGSQKPTPYIEDAAVPPEVLAEYVAEVLEVCKRHNQPVSMFGHASVGLIHIRPLHDLHKPEEIDRMRRIQDEVFPLVRKYRGSWSGEHGDGIVRGGYNRQYFGERLYTAFREIKHIFDPEGRMNPGKIIDTPDIGEHLRFGTNYHPQQPTTRFHFRDQGGILAAAEQCTGVGACRKDLAGVMCPSYMATKDELHSTRGRANALRLALTGQLGEPYQEAISSQGIKEAMELCLACKGCKGECPNGVDMARLKAEVLYHHRKKHGTPLRTHLFAALPTIGRFATGPHAPIINALIGNRPLRALMGKALRITPERRLPSFTRERLSSWHAKRQSSKRGETILLFNDTYTEYFQPQVGRAAIECLEAAGYRVELATFGDSQRIAITHGLLDQAKKRGNRLFQQLDRLLDTDQPIVVCEPSCASSLADDLPDLLEDETLAKRVSQRVIMFDRFLEQELSQGKVELKWVVDSPRKTPKFLIHSHCHQKTLDGGRWSQQLLQRIPGAEVSDTEAGCCGMAGTFGYEQEHAELSRKIAQRRLIPKLNEASEEAWVVSNGFSCRHQIADLTTRTPIHIAEAIRMYI